MTTLVGLFAGIFLVLLVVLFLLVFDSLGGISLNERITVKERKFSPATFVFTGKVIIPVAQHWTFKVANQRGQGTVVVDQALYEATAEGDVLVVTGKKGRISGRWYLKGAHKEA